MNKTAELTKKLGIDRVKLNESLGTHTVLRVGGLADYYYEATNADELALACRSARELDIPYYILGFGANVLISDNGLRGLVIRNKAKTIRFLPHDFIEADSGVSNADLIKETTQRGLSGLERLVKVPGTLGGAVYMNAGDTAKKAFIGDIVSSVKVLDKENNVKKVYGDESEFAYRFSRFQKSGEVILSAILQLQKASKEEIEEKVKDILLRKKHHPSGPTAGSTFKNPPSNYAGKLIEEAGLKGKQIGGAKFSEQHANFIINFDNAGASDIKALIDLAKKEVSEKFNIKLEEEIRYLGEF